MFIGRYAALLNKMYITKTRIPIKIVVDMIIVYKVCAQSYQMNVWITTKIYF